MEEEGSVKAGSSAIWHVFPVPASNLGLIFAGTFPESKKGDLSSVFSLLHAFPISQEILNCAFLKKALVFYFLALFLVSENYRKVVLGLF